MGAGAGAALNFARVAVALSGVNVMPFLVALMWLGWNGAHRKVAALS
jgi:hypothetical protein